MEEILLYFSLKYKGDFEQIYKALERKEKVDEVLKKELLTSLHCKYVTMVSKDYPESLKYISCPPFVLYYYGNLQYIQSPTIAVVGMRKPSSYGLQSTNTMVSNLVEQGYTIVSGLALGIDARAHECAMMHGGKTIAILGSGIDCCFPKSNQQIYTNIKKNHLLISEYPGDTVAKKQNFPRRNRIVAGLSQSVLVVEANCKSGTMITVGHALEQGKDIFCIPGRMTDALGCNILIQQGAKLVNSVQDILEE